MVGLDKRCYVGRYVDVGHDHQGATVDVVVGNHAVRRQVNA
jgi:hypothetical protein